MHQHFTTFFFLFPINLRNVRLPYKFRSDSRPSLSLFDQEKSRIICRVCMYWMCCVYGVLVWYVGKECIVICKWVCYSYGVNVLCIWSECVVCMERMCCVYGLHVTCVWREFMWDASECVVNMEWMCSAYGANALRVWGDCIVSMKWVCCVYGMNMLCFWVNVLSAWREWVSWVFGANVLCTWSECIVCLEWVCWYLEWMCMAWIYHMILVTVSTVCRIIRVRKRLVHNIFCRMTFIQHGHMSVWRVGKYVRYVLLCVSPGPRVSPVWNIQQKPFHWRIEYQM